MEMEVDKENETPVVVKSDVSPEELEKQEWSRKMRLKFSPPEMLNEDGSLNKG